MAMINFNGKLTIGTKATQNGFDEETGQPIIEVTTSEIDCYLEQVRPQSDFNLPGVNNPIAYLEGRIKGNATLTPNQFYPLTITLQTGETSGRFYLLATPICGLNLNSYFGGAFISGWLCN